MVTSALCILFGTTYSFDYMAKKVTSKSTMVDAVNSYFSLAVVLTDPKPGKRKFFKPF